MSFKRIVVGVSGGVDSAVTAYILKSKGYEVHGAFMKNWDIVDETGYCSSVQDWEDAQRLCRKLEIPLQEVNFVKDYWLEVFGNFLKDYENGLTPNPDILCNRHIKFNLFYKFARERLKADAIATGHYARNSFGQFLEHFDVNKKPKLLKAVDKFKDQTFFLSQMNPNALRRTMFPIGDLTKQTVKAIASDVGLEMFAKKKESVGICFVGKRSFKDFISAYIDVKEGSFVDIDTGEVIGVHNGIHNWTVGQKCNVSGRLVPYFVLQKDVQTNIIHVVSDTHHPLLFTDMLYTEEPFWINKPDIEATGLFKCQFRFQHTRSLVDCTIFRINKASENLFIKLETPLRALTPGQYAVFYKGDQCLGSARISKPGPSILYA